MHWDVPVYADHIEVHTNRVDARIVDKENQTVTLLEMSCPWVENREQKREEENSQVRPTTSGAETAIPRVQDHPSEHYNRCSGGLLQGTVQQC